MFCFSMTGVCLSRFSALKKKTCSIPEIDAFDAHYRKNMDERTVPMHPLLSLRKCGETESVIALWLGCGPFEMRFLLLIFRGLLKRSTTSNLYALSPLKLESKYWNLVLIPHHMFCMQCHQVIYRILLPSREGNIKYLCVTVYHSIFTYHTKPQKLLSLMSSCCILRYSMQHLIFSSLIAFLSWKRWFKRFLPKGCAILNSEHSELSWSTFFLPKRVFKVKEESSLRYYWKESQYQKCFRAYFSRTHNTWESVYGQGQRDEPSFFYRHRNSPNQMNFFLRKDGTVVVLFAAACGSWALYIHTNHVPLKKEVSTWAKNDPEKTSNPSLFC